MVRVFAAIEIPPEICARMWLIRAAIPTARWIGAEDMHLTLRFAGDVEHQAADDFAEALAEIEADPFPLTIAGVGSFGGRDPHALWAGIKPSEPLAALQRATERAARTAGLPPEPRKFAPHITLARLKRARPHDVAMFLAENGGLSLEPFMVERFVMLSSRPGVGGGPYAIEAEFPLGATHFKHDVED
jgi:2'-5' RNA ligase